MVGGIWRSWRRRLAYWRNRQCSTWVICLIAMRKHLRATSMAVRPLASRRWKCQRTETPHWTWPELTTMAMRSRCWVLDRFEAVPVTYPLRFSSPKTRKAQVLTSTMGRSEELRLKSLSKNQKNKPMRLMYNKSFQLHHPIRKVNLLQWLLMIQRTNTSSRLAQPSKRDLIKTWHFKADEVFKPGMQIQELQKPTQA